VKRNIILGLFIAGSLWAGKLAEVEYSTITWQQEKYISGSYSFGDSTTTAKSNYGAKISSTGIEATLILLNGNSITDLFISTAGDTMSGTLHMGENIIEDAYLEGSYLVDTLFADGNKIVQHSTSPTANGDVSTKGYCDYAIKSYEGFVSTTGDTMSGNLVVPKIDLILGVIEQNGDELLFTDDIGNTSFGGNISTTGEANSSLGYLALANNITGQSNVAIGMQALEDNTTGHYNTAIGCYSLMNSIYGNCKVAIGFGALENNTTGSGNIAIGHNAGFYETGSDKLYIENSDSSSPLIYGDFASNFLRINGYLDMVNNYIKNVSTYPTNVGDVSTKGYCDYVVKEATNVISQLYAAYNATATYDADLKKDTFTFTGQITFADKTTFSSNTFTTGFSSAAKFYGDISNCTGQAAADNLGNHTATEQLKMGSYDIFTSSGITGLEKIVWADGTVQISSPPAGGNGVAIEYIQLLRGYGAADIYNSSDTLKPYGTWWQGAGVSGDITGFDVFVASTTTDAFTVRIWIDGSNFEAFAISAGSTHTIISTTTALSPTTIIGCDFEGVNAADPAGGVSIMVTTE